MTIITADPDVLDLRQLLTWWRPRAWILLICALSGFLFGLYQRHTFTPEYTAQAKVFVQDWRRQLDLTAERAQTALALPALPIVPIGERDNEGTHTIRSTGPSSQAAIDSVSKLVADLIDKTAERDRRLEPYVSVLRDLGAAEIALHRPEPIVLVPPQIFHQTTFLDSLIGLYAVFGVLFGIILGGIWYSLSKERV